MHSAPAWSPARGAAFSRAHARRDDKCFHIAFLIYLRVVVVQGHSAYKERQDT